MRYLVTGGAGTLGARVCQQLLQGGDEVVAHDLGPGDTLAGVVGEDVAQRILVRGDITEGLHLLHTCREQGVEAIVHTASLLSAASIANPAQAIRINSGGMANVLETARILGIRRVAWASSAGVFGGYQHDSVVANDAPYRPANVYGGTKVLNEVLAEQYCRLHGLETIGMRFTLLVGPMPHGGFNGIVWRELIDKPVRGLPSRVPFADDTPGWLWIDDAARSLVLAARATNSTTSRAFNVDGDVRSVREAAAIVRRLVPGADITLEPGTGGLHRWLDTAPVEKELGFTIEWRLEDQLRALVDAARARAAGKE